MHETCRAYLGAAGGAATLLRDPAVIRAWDRPSVLPAFSVSGLAGHLARQILRVGPVLGVEPPPGASLTLTEHYRRSAWVGAALGDPANMEIRQEGEETAQGGPEHLADLTQQSLDRLESDLPHVSLDRQVHLPWGPWSLRFEDYLSTRMVEISIHCDDLALSVDTEMPPLPQDATDMVVSLLAQVAARRHGAVAVLRTLARAERAPSTVVAI